MRTRSTCACLIAILFFALHAAPSAAATATGRITAIAAQPDGGASVSGWACQPGNPASVQVELFVGDRYPVGQLVSATAADADSAAPACGTRHGFAFRLPAATMFRYGALPIFAYAVPADRSGNVLLEAPAGAALPAYTPLTGPPRICDITDIPTLKRCVAQLAQYDQFSLRQDLACTSASDCCGSGNGPLIPFDKVDRYVLEGNGHIIHHGPGALVCATIGITLASNILVKNLAIDEDQSIPPCELAVKSCPNTISVDRAKNTRLDDVHIYFGKGDVIQVWGSDGFVLIRSSLSDSGIIGVYVGHYKFAPSKNVVIADCVIARSRTSSIALQGAYASDPADPVLLIGNVINQNHWHGLWPNPTVPNGISTGGQVLLADGSNIRMTGNIVADGACQNCNPPNPAGAIEISDQAAPPGGVRGLTIDHNFLYNAGGWAIGQNRGMLLSDVTITDNRIEGYPRMDVMASPARRERNILHQDGGARDLHGAATYEVLRVVAAGQHHAERLVGEYPGARLEAVFALSPAPRPDAAWTALFRCTDGVDFISRSRGCEGAGQLNALAGYSYELGYPAAKPFYSCQSSGPGADRFPSWDANCEGQKVIGELGFAVPKTSPTRLVPAKD